jgi:hypothetical protein
MGNCLASRDESNTGLFDCKETEILRSSFNAYFDRIPEARRHHAFSKTCFEEIFSENPRFS